MFLLIRCCIDPYISLPFSSILFTKTLILFQTMNNLVMPFCIVFHFQNYYIWVQLYRTVKGIVFMIFSYLIIFTYSG